MKKFNFTAGIFENTKEGGADEFAATNDGDGGVFEVNIVAGKKPENGSSGGGVKSAIFAKTVYVFSWRDEISKLIGDGFIYKG